MKCRHCNAALTSVFVDLGLQPPSNSFLNEKELVLPEAMYPLKTLVCPECYLVQVDELKAAKEIFNHDYVYFSSFSSSWLEHARRYTEMAVERFGLDSSSQVVEIASNDGYLLQYMKQKGVPCYGVEPSTATAEAAREKGVESIIEFFGESFARQLVQERGEVDLLIGNNVLAHVPDINDFVAGIKTLLKKDGVATLEFPHLMRLVAECQFDTIYHEHFSYLSLGTVSRVVSKAGLRVFDVEELETHGGSLRVFLEHDSERAVSVSQSVSELLALELRAGMESLEYYTAFQHAVDERKRAFLSFLARCEEEKKTVAAYGAAAKGNTFLNYCGVDNLVVRFCVDASPHKQELFMPGSHIPVLAPEALREAKPDYVLILPWNLKSEIVKQHSYIREWNGRFVTAIPQLEIHDPSAF